MTTVTRNQGRRVRIGYGGVLLGALVLFFILLLDQGQTLSLIQGEIAYAQRLVHELVHDARHTTAVPCH